MKNIENNMTLSEAQLQQVITYTTGRMETKTVSHLPIVRAYLKKMNVIQIMDDLMPTERQISPGIIVAGLITDALSGRSPLYRLEKFS